MRRVREATGNPTAWETGLTRDEVNAVLTATTRPEQLDEILRKIRRQHPDVFKPEALPGEQAGPHGDAAEAIARAEAALAHQHTVSSQLDLQVISAILNAHLKAGDGRAALTTLQQEVEAAVRTRSDLDTAAGARDFQRFLIGKLRDIRAVVADASLDDTSKSALMAAWTSLYNAANADPDGPRDEHPPAARPVGSPVPAAGGTDAGSDPYLDALLADDPGLLAGESSAPAATPAATGMPMTPTMPSVPGLGAGLTPGSATPAAMPGLSVPGGLGLPSQGSGVDRALKDLDDEPYLPPEDRERDDHETTDDADKDGEHKDPSSTTPEIPPTGPTTVTLPDGETVTAASPQLAAAIKAAAGGMAIPDAFRQQGITIPPPGTPVAHPIEAARVTPGDIGMFTDRHALALGNSKVILDGQIQHISTVSGPSFLGWEHPPTPAAAQIPAPTPTPTRPSAAPVAWATSE